MKFRKKPVVIDAVQWNGENPMEILEFMKIVAPEEKDRHSVIVLDGDLKVQTLEGLMNANKGDWIIRGVNGEYYPCKPNIFVKTYDPAE